MSDVPSSTLGGTGSPQGPPRSKNDVVYELFRPVRDFIWRYAQDGALTSEIVQRVFTEALIDLSRYRSSDQIRQTLMADAVKLSIIARKGSHFSFENLASEDSAFPFRDRILVQLRAGGNFQQAYAACDILDRALVSAAAARVPGTILCKTLPISGDTWVRRLEGTLQDLSAQFETRPAPESCGTYDISDIRRTVLEAGTSDGQTEFQRHLREGCPACQEGLRAVELEREILLQSIETIAVPPGDLQGEMRAVLNVPEMSAAAFEGTSRIRISREMALFLAFLGAIVLVAALWGVTELIYNSGDPEPPPARNTPRSPNRVKPPKSASNVNALIKKLSHPNTAQRSQAIRALVELGETALPKVTPLTGARSKRVRQSAQQVVVGIIRKVIDEARKGAGKIPKPTAGELRKAWQAFRSTLAKDQDTRDKLKSSLSGMTGLGAEAPDATRLRNRLLDTETRLLHTENLSRAEFEKRHLADLAFDTALELHDLRFLSRHLDFDGAMSYQESGSVTLSWRKQMARGLSMKIKIPAPSFHPLGLIRRMEKILRRPILLHPQAASRPMPRIKAPEKAIPLRHLLSNLASFLQMGWEEIDGCVLIGPAGENEPDRLMDRLASFLEKAPLDAFAARTLDRIMPVTFGFDPDLPASDERNAQALSSFRTWFNSARTRIIFDEEEGRYTIKLG